MVSQQFDFKPKVGFLLCSSRIRFVHRKQRPGRWVHRPPSPTPIQHVGGDHDQHAPQQTCQRLSLGRESFCETRAAPSAADPPGNEQQCHRPRDHPRDAHSSTPSSSRRLRRRQAKTRSPRSSACRSQDQSGHYEKPATDPVEPGDRAGGEPDHPEPPWIYPRRSTTGPSPSTLRPRSIMTAIDQHQQREQDKQPVAVNDLADRRAGDTRRPARRRRRSAPGASGHAALAHAASDWRKH